MANKLDKIEVVGKFNHLQIKETTDSGIFHRRVLTPDMDVSGEVAEIQDKAEALWTDEVKTAWSDFDRERCIKVRPCSL